MSSKIFNRICPETAQYLSPQGKPLSISGSMSYIVSLEAATRMMHEAFQARFDLPESVNSTPEIERAIICNTIYLRRVCRRDLQVGEEFRVYVLGRQGLVPLDATIAEA